MWRSRTLWWDAYGRTTESLRNNNNKGHNAALGCNPGNRHIRIRCTVAPGSGLSICTVTASSFWQKAALGSEPGTIDIFIRRTMPRPYHLHGPIILFLADSRPWLQARQQIFLSATPGSGFSIGTVPASSISRTAALGSEPGNRYSFLLHRCTRLWP